MHSITASEKPVHSNSPEDGELNKADLKSLRLILDRYVALIAETDSEDRHELRKAAWTNDPTGKTTQLLSFLTFKLLIEWSYASTLCVPLVWDLVRALSFTIGDLNNSAEQAPGFYSEIARKFPSWPCLLNERTVSEKSVAREEMLKFLSALGVGADHPRRKMKKLGGTYGVEVTKQFETLSFLRAGHDLIGFSALKRGIVSAARKLPQLSTDEAAQTQWYELGLELMRSEYGKNFHDHPHFAKPLMKAKADGKKAGVQQDIVKKAMWEQWKTLAGYVTLNAVPEH